MVQKKGGPLLQYEDPSGSGYTSTKKNPYMSEASRLGCWGGAVKAEPACKSEICEINIHDLGSGSVM